MVKERLVQSITLYLKCFKIRSKEVFNVFQRNTLYFIGILRIRFRIILIGHFKLIALAKIDSFVITLLIRVGLKGHFVINFIVDIFINGQLLSCFILTRIIFNKPSCRSYLIMTFFIS